MIDGREIHKQRGSHGEEIYTERGDHGGVIHTERGTHGSEVAVYCTRKNIHTEGGKHGRAVHITTHTHQGNIHRQGIYAQRKLCVEEMYTRKGQAQGGDIL